ncbi:hypothetical protein ISF_01479 [Cordyceps fumosorosea ARSEF 2679]|uniref:Uncharacterized protein n=1 Tax=Cordyceps fumosorosea (strain ARSEF 2679) TaxID=1081104 RepID=A0A168DBL8_CORFA|nr:hypothetical protein ISF_01479 [Cordyceps fumosorosea ARSEF 2679]OAA72406.1 hypothetical protein ISF_01479 [Cordyceps fumosorosea ARSEF 2679]
MFSTKPANSLRKLFAGYHEPAGLSPQQSQKLLDGLKSSFRLQLEQEYGQTALTKLTKNTSKTLSNSSSSSPHRAVRHSAANRHLRSILANPLFSYNNNSVTANSTLPSPLSVPRSDPLDDFDHAVAKGLMTLNAATGCIMTKQKQLDARDLHTGPASESATALRVVRWLRSTGAENDLAFLDHAAFIKALTPFLVVERMDEIAWQWIAQTMEQRGDDAAEATRLRRASFLLAQLVHVKSQPRHGNLDGAITTILRAEQLLAKDPLLAKLLVLPWRSVSWLSTVESYSHGAPSERLFDAHLDTASRLQQPLSVETAHLRLCHPTHPDHAPAMHFFRDTRQLRRLVRGITREQFTQAKQKSLSVVPWVAYLGYDTVNHLTTSGLTQEAQALKQILQDELAGLFAPQAQPS